MASGKGKGDEEGWGEDADERGGGEEDEMESGEEDEVDEMEEEYEGEVGWGDGDADADADALDVTQVDDYSFESQEHATGRALRAGREGRGLNRGLKRACNELSSDDDMIDGEELPIVMNPKKKKTPAQMRDIAKNKERSEQFEKLQLAALAASVKLASKSPAAAKSALSTKASASTSASKSAAPTPDDQELLRLRTLFSTTNVQAAMLRSKGYLRGIADSHSNQNLHRSPIHKYKFDGDNSLVAKSKIFSEEAQEAVIAQLELWHKGDVNRDLRHFVLLDKALRWIEDCLLRDDAKGIDAYNKRRKWSTHAETTAYRKISRENATLRSERDFLQPGEFGRDGLDINGYERPIKSNLGTPSTGTSTITNTKISISTIDRTTSTIDCTTGTNADTTGTGAGTTGATSTPDAPVTQEEVLAFLSAKLVDVVGRGLCLALAVGSPTDQKNVCISQRNVNMTKHAMDWICKMEEVATEGKKMVAAATSEIPYEATTFSLYGLRFVVVCGRWSGRWSVVGGVAGGV
jgi:hypothetical protein